MDVDVREQLLQPEGRTARNVNVNVFDSGAPYSSSDDDSDSDGDETALGKDGSGVPLTQTVAPVQEESAENRVAGAAIYLYEGLRYLKFAFHPRTPAQLRAFRRLHQSPYSIVYRLELATAIIFMMLALIERPAAVYVQPWVVMIIELLCVAFFTWDIVMRVRVCGGMSRWLKHVGNMFRLIAIIASVAECIVYVAMPTYLRPIRVLRPFFLLDAYSAAGVRRVLHQILRTGIVVVEMVVLLLVYVLIWAVLAFYFFGAPATKASGDQPSPFFTTFDETYVSLFVAITTANYPDVSMVSMNNNKFSAIFFVVYVGIGLYFVLNLFLALVFQGFTERDESKFRRMLLHKRHALRKAFSKMADVNPEEPLEALGSRTEYEARKQMSFPVFHKLLKEFRPTTTPKDALLTFEYLDRVNMSSPGSANKQLDRQEFYQLYQALDLRWELNRKATLNDPESVDPPMYSHQPWKWLHEHMQWTENPWVDTFIYTAITVNAVVVVALAAELDLSDQTDGEYKPPGPQGWEYGFFALYFAEALVRIFVRGWRRYFHNRWCQFDFFIIVLSVSDFLVAALSPSHSGSYGTIFRSIRLLRLFRVRPSFRHVLNTMAVLLKHMVRYVIVLLTVQYSFAIIGMVSMHHTVSKDCTPSLCGAPYSNDQHDTSFRNETLYYGLLSFDNLLLSYNTLFDLMVVNNWQLIMEGHVAVLGRKARTFFIVYFLFVVLIVCNVIVAFLLDAFIKIHPLMRTRRRAAVAAKRAVEEADDGHAPDDAAVHRRTHSLKKIVRRMTKRFRRHAGGGQTDDTSPEVPVPVMHGASVAGDSTLSIGMSRHAIEGSDPLVAYQEFLLALVKALHASQSDEATDSLVTLEGQEQLTFVVPFRLAIQSTSLPGEASLREFKRSMLPMLQRLWRRERLRLDAKLAEAEAAALRLRCNSIETRRRISASVAQGAAAAGTAASAAAAVSQDLGRGAMRTAFETGAVPEARMAARQVAAVDMHHNELEQVVRITLSSEDLRRFCPNDRDLAVLDELRDDIRQAQTERVKELTQTGQPLLPEDLQGTGELHYVARRRLRKSDIEQALWGQKIEHWCMEDELKSLLSRGYDDDEHDRDPDHH